MQDRYLAVNPINCDGLVYTLPEEKQTKIDR